MSGKIDPVIQEIIEGTILAAEREMEDLVERTARSPMIRDQHDYRVGLFDRLGNKLTGRSYSAVVDPILKNFPIDEMREGDVFLHNDCYLSEGGIGHLPDLCSTVPIFYAGQVAAFAIVFGHHDDIGGMVPGSMPTYATEAFQEGIMIPPIRLYDAGALNRAAYDILFRNSRLGDHLRADIDAEIGACRAGAERIVELFSRYGKETVFSCFDALLDRCEEIVSRELLSKIPDGTYAWEDYIENDGVVPDKVHKIRLSMTKKNGRLILDFNGTDPQARGPINWPANYANGKFLKKWIGPILRNLADTPERANEIDINEGVCRLIEVRFPPEGTLITPKFPAPTNMRMFTILRLLGIFSACIAQAVKGKMPADQETIRIWGLHGRDRDGELFIFREVLGGGSGGREYADGSDAIHIVPNSRNLPAEFSEIRYSVRVEKLALCPDSGGPGKRRGGLGYLKEFTVLSDAGVFSLADRSKLACWGVNGGKAGGNYRIILNLGTRKERVLPALCDNVPVKKGDRIRVITTGGGGWGDPLRREVERVQLDVIQGKVTREGARRDYGVVFGPGERCPVDAKATETLRKRLRRTRKKSFIDRGEYFEKVVRKGLRKKTRGGKAPVRG